MPTRTTFRARPQAAFACIVLLLGLTAAPVPGAEPASARPGENGARVGRPPVPVYHSPQCIRVSPDGQRAFVVNATANSVSVIDTVNRRVLGEIPVGARPYQAVFSPDGSAVYVTCSWAARVEVIDAATLKVIRSLPAGLEPHGLSVSRDGRRLYVTNSMTDEITIVDTKGAAAPRRIQVGNQPRFATETPDGRRVIVSNNLGRCLTFVDTETGAVVETRDLGRCSMLREIVCSSDGRWAFVANLVSHDEAPTLQIERGWIHSNGFTIVDLTRPGHRVTLLLDELIRGAANPTGLALSSDNRYLYVTLAGVHEVAVVDVERCLQIVADTTTPDAVRRLQEDVEIVARLGVAKRVPSGGVGPRSLALVPARNEVWVAHYFTNNVSILESVTGKQLGTVELGPIQEMNLWRTGEMLSCDARICYQNWYSCVSCHQEDGTVDGLNWDLANDGLGNPKNAKDLLNAHDTAPAMWGAVRADLNDGVAGGQRFLGFVADAEKQKALMAYFGDPEHTPNPFKGLDPEAETRGRRLFVETGCTICHPAPLFTDLKVHDLRMRGPDDYRSRFDTPSLRGVYRSGPWLHDGRAKTLHGLFSEHNPHDVHGRTKGLTPRELDDLITYLRTL